MDIRHVMLVQIVQPVNIVLLGEHVEFVQVKKAHHRNPKVQLQKNHNHPVNVKRQHRKEPDVPEHQDLRGFVGNMGGKYKLFNMKIPILIICILLSTSIFGQEATEAAQVDTALSDVDTTLIYWGPGINEYYKRDYDAALIKMKKHLETNPNKISTIYQIAFIEFLKSDYKHALADFNKVIALAKQNFHKDYAKVFIYRGKTFFALKKYDEAIKDFDKSIDLDSTSGYSFVQKALCLEILGYRSKALLNYNLAIEKCTYCGFFENRGDFYSRNKEFEKAIDDYNLEINESRKFFGVSLNQSERNSKIHIKKGENRMDLNDIDGAILDFSLAIKIDSLNYESYYLRGSCYYLKEKFDSAMIDLNQSIKLNSKYSDAYETRGAVKNGLEDYRGAILDFNKAISLDSNIYLAYFYRGNAKEEIKLYKDALIDYNKAISIKPEIGYFFYKRAEVNYLLGNRNSACIDWSKAGELGIKEAYERIKKNCNN